MCSMLLKVTQPSLSDCYGLVYTLGFKKYDTPMRIVKDYMVA